MGTISTKLTTAKIFTISGESPTAFGSLKTIFGWIDIFLPLLPIFIALLFASSSIKPITLVKMDVLSGTRMNLPLIK
jgi:hypothetical protein